jgi:hypothetical protein
MITAVHMRVFFQSHCFGDAENSQRGEFWSQAPLFFASAEYQLRIAIANWAAAAHEEYVLVQF